MGLSALKPVLTWWIALLLCGSGIALYGCRNRHEQTLPYYDTPDFTPHFEGRSKHMIAGFSFLNQDGMVVDNESVKGKVQVANFFFTWCGSICPSMMDNLKAVQDAYGTSNDVAILSYSVTPWIDSVPKLKKYAVNRGIVAPQWNLLTGNKAAIYTLARKSYFAEENFGYNKDSTEFLHTEHFLLIDKQQHIRGIYNGTLRLEVEQLIKDIAVLREED